MLYKYVTIQNTYTTLPSWNGFKQGGIYGAITDRVYHTGELESRPYKYPHVCTNTTSDHAQQVSPLVHNSTIGVLCPLLLMCVVYC